MPRHLLATIAVLALVSALTGCATKGSVAPAIAGKANSDATADAIEGTRVVSIGASLSSAEDPLALRMPAQVMRIWIAPWEDSRGDLHAPGYVYTEIEPRRWTLGAPAESDRETLIRPLQIERRDTPTNTRSSRDTGTRRTPRKTRPDTGPNLLGS